MEREERNTRSFLPESDRNSSNFRILSFHIHQLVRFGLKFRKIKINTDDTVVWGQVLQARGSSWQYLHLSVSAMLQSMMFGQ